MRSVRTGTRAGPARNFVNCRSIGHFEKRLPLSCQYFAVGHQAAIHALADGYDVFVVTDASGGVSPEAHEMAVRRMKAAGAVPLTWLAVISEWQRDWARPETAASSLKCSWSTGKRPGSHTPGKCSR